MFIVEAVGGRPEEQEILAFGIEITAIWRDAEKTLQKKVCCCSPPGPISFVVNLLMAHIYTYI
jgi:hypothetical protein